MEATLAEVYAQLKANPSDVKVVGDSLASIRAIQEKVLEDADATPKLQEVVPLASDEALEGQAVVVLRKGMMHGVEGRVRRANKGQVEVDVKGMIVRMKRAELGKRTKTVTETTSSVASKMTRAAARPGISKRTAAYLEQEAESGRSPKRQGGPTAPSSTPSPTKITARFDGNTCDLRGFKLEDAIEEAQRFMAARLMAPSPVVYLLHGHGTGALKKGLREWLRTSPPGVKRWRVADQANGGDALTMVELR